MTFDLRKVLNLVLLLVVLTDCAGRGDKSTIAGPPPRPIDEDLLDLVPAGTTGVLRIDLAQIKASALWEAIEILSGDPQLDKVKSVTGVDAIERYDEVIFAFASSDQESSDEFLVLAKGTFDAELLFRTVLEDEEMRLEQIGDTKVAWSQDYLFAAVTGRTFMLGTAPMISKVIDLVGGKGDSASTVPELGDFSLDGATAARLFYRRPLHTPDFSSYGVASSAINVESIAGLDGQLELSEGLSAALVITTQTQLDASSLERSIKKAQKRLGRNMLLVLFGVDWILEKIAITADRKTVTLKMALDQRDLEEIKHMAERISKMRTLTDEQRADPRSPGDAPDDPGASTDKSKE